MFTNLNVWKIEVVRSEDITHAPDHRGTQEMAQMHNKQYERATDTSKYQEDNSDLPF